MRIAARAASVPGQRPARLVHLGRRPSHRRRDRRQRRIDPRQFVQTLARTRGRHHGRFVTRTEERLRFLRATTELLRRGQHPPLLRQRFVLAGLGVGLLQLVEL
ncbi:MAG: hypothetical protein E6J58_19595, partial [Deltaproteobacteria bacterium]